MADDIGAAVNDWVSVVRRARLGSTAHSVAMTVATYANPDGTKVYPGVARLAYQCQCSYAAVRRALARLRQAGLLEVVKRGSRRAGRSDEYRLILAPDLLDRLDVPTPEQERVAIDEMKHHERHYRSAVSGNESALYRSAVSGNESFTAHYEPVLPLSPERPPSIAPSLKEHPPCRSPLELDSPPARDRQENPLMHLAADPRRCVRCHHLKPPGLDGPLCAPCDAQAGAA